MTADTPPDYPRYGSAPVEDAEVGVQQIRIFVEDMDAAIGTSPVVPGIDEALAMADRLNRPSGWTAFAAKCMRAAARPPV